MLNDITLFIKTFERPKSLKRLLKSIHCYYPEISILIVDDSKTQIKESELLSIHTNLQYYHVDYDVGLSKGRNIGLSKIETKFFVLLDDDFYFTKNTDLIKLVSVIDNNDFDMVGFDFYDYGFCKRNFQGTYSIENNMLIRSIGDSKCLEKGYRMYDFILNCFVARTSFFKDNQWDEQIKIGSEHDDFFLNIKYKKPKITHVCDVSIAHYPKYTKEYQGFRKERFNKYFIFFLQKNNLKGVLDSGSVYSKKDRFLIKVFAMLGRFRYLLNMNQ